MYPLVLGYRFRLWSPRSPCTCHQHRWWSNLAWCIHTHTTSPLIETGDPAIMATGDPAIMATGEPSIMHHPGDPTIIRAGTTIGGDERAPLDTGNTTTMTMLQSCRGGHPTERRFPPGDAG